MSRYGRRAASAPPLNPIHNVFAGRRLDLRVCHPLECKLIELLLLTGSGLPNLAWIGLLASVNNAALNRIL